MSHDLTIRLRQQEKRFQSLLDGIEETLTHQNQEYKQMQQALTEVQQEFLTQQEMFLARVEQQRSEFEGTLEQRWSELAHERTAQREHMEMIEHRLESVEIQDQSTRKIWLVYQERTEDQDRRIQMLTTMLHDERVARQLFSDQLTFQQEQIQMLCRELERFKNEKAVFNGDGGTG